MMPIIEIKPKNPKVVKDLPDLVAEESEKPKDEFDLDKPLTPDKPGTVPSGK